jgi:hypothetical protein
MAPAYAMCEWGEATSTPLEVAAPPRMDCTTDAPASASSIAMSLPEGPEPTISTWLDAYAVGERYRAACTANLKIGTAGELGHEGSGVMAAADHDCVKGLLPPRLWVANSHGLNEPATLIAAVLPLNIQYLGPKSHQPLQAVHVRVPLEVPLHSSVRHKGAAFILGPLERHISEGHQLNG